MTKAGTKAAGVTEERFHALMERIQKLEQIIDGDPEIRDPGLIVVIDKAIVMIPQMLGTIADLTARLSKLEAFLAPAINGAAPPLDGAQIATKVFVDQSLERVAGALRSEWRRLGV